LQLKAVLLHYSRVKVRNAGKTDKHKVVGKLGSFRLLKWNFYITLWKTDFVSCLAVWRILVKVPNGCVSAKSHNSNNHW
jgi:hypothetical protein